MEEATVDEPLLAVPRGGDGEDGAMAAAAAVEVKRLLRLAGPLVASFLLRNAVQIVSVMFVGHLGDLQVAVASFAVSLANMTGFSVLTGMASALDTLCGQAFGARQHRLLGIYVQRAILDPAIAAEAGAYVRAAHLPVRFLQAQSIVVPVDVSSAVTAVTHVAVCWVLVYKAGMGSRGAALSGGVTYWTNLAILALYVRLSSACETTWTGFSMDAFQGAPLVHRARRAVRHDGLVGDIIWWSFELLVLLSGNLPNPKLETSILSICMNTHCFSTVQGAIWHLLIFKVAGSLEQQDWQRESPWP
ncbi:hypothetical protein E2562_027925 [Oryza meyeriana var. granulata]|uniref:Protein DETOXIFICATION n=1 Tax=Oryza meyeriana var. granulata TaxID=110450 RepID=A0A6G1EZT3_9ORYZ|nr:hypothetical protein E2562_027925 [Oryza meyeriana var. granulata]